MLREVVKYLKEDKVKIESSKDTVSLLFHGGNVRAVARTFFGGAVHAYKSRS